MRRAGPASGKGPPEVLESDQDAKPQTGWKQQSPHEALGGTVGAAALKGLAGSNGPRGSAATVKGWTGTDGAEGGAAALRGLAGSDGPGRGAVALERTAGADREGRGTG